MKEYIIYWNSGFGENSEILEADSLEEAKEFAYHVALEEAQSGLDWGALGATPQNREDYSYD